MSDLSLWKNQQMGLLRKDLDRLFDRWLSSITHGQTGQGVPSVDLVERAEELIVKAEVPGFQPEDLELTVSEKALTIQGRRGLRVSEDTDIGVFLERGVQSFSRTIRLPYRVDQERIEASYEEGVLTVRMPILASAGRRRIEITVK